MPGLKFKIDEKDEDLILKALDIPDDCSEELQLRVKSRIRDMIINGYNLVNHGKEESSTRYVLLDKETLKKYVKVECQDQIREELHKKCIEGINSLLKQQEERNEKLEEMLKFYTTYYQEFMKGEEEKKKTAERVL